MSIPRASLAQTRAIRNLMFSIKNMETVMAWMTSFGKKFLGELSVGEAKEIISDLVWRH